MSRMLQKTFLPGYFVKVVIDNTTTKTSKVLAAIETIIGVSIYDVYSDPIDQDTSMIVGVDCAENLGPFFNAVSKWPESVFVYNMVDDPAEFRQAA
jgi:hypothetical protein